MIDQKERDALKALGFRVEQFDIHNNLKMGLSSAQVPDPNHWAAYLYPHGRNGVFWVFPSSPRPATEAECWAAVEAAVRNNEIDFDTFNGKASRK